MHAIAISMDGFGLALGMASWRGRWRPAQVRTLKAVTYAGKRYVALKDLAKMYGLPLTSRGRKSC